MLTLLDIKNRLPKGIAVQGNLDPHILYADKKVIKDRITGCSSV
jgi:uroporphyrinogen decarboxylase